jgi:asparagine synthase (glutamine-hydrolysing)
MREVSYRWVITFNGEIYNHAELRAELETLGCNFATRSDTEVLINVVARRFIEGRPVSLGTGP